MFPKEERVDLTQCYGGENVSYKYTIDLFYQKFPYTFVSKGALRKLLKEFRETGFEEYQGSI